MQIELFLDDIDRDLFDSPSIDGAGWNEIYKDLGPWMPQTNQHEGSFTIDHAVQLAGRVFAWKKPIVMRKDQGGGLLMAVGSPKVYRLDEQAFQAIAILWAGKTTSFLAERKFSDRDKHELLTRLEDLDLIEWN